MLRTPPPPKKKPDTRWTKEMGKIFKSLIIDEEWSVLILFFYLILILIIQARIRSWTISNGVINKFKKKTTN